MTARLWPANRKAMPLPDGPLPTPNPPPVVVPELKSSPRGMDRRRFLGYVLAGPSWIAH